MDNFKVIKRMRRFSQSVLELEDEKGRRLQFIEGEFFKKVYEKTINFIKCSDFPSKTVITFLNSDYISFLCSFNGYAIPLNYSFLSEHFERDSVVLKYADFSTKDIYKALKHCDKKLKICRFALYLIPDGIGVLANKDGQMSIKVRKNKNSS